MKDNVFPFWPFENEEKHLKKKEKYKKKNPTIISKETYDAIFQSCPSKSRDEILKVLENISMKTQIELKRESKRTKTSLIEWVERYRDLVLPLLKE